MKNMKDMKKTVMYTLNAENATLHLSKANTKIGKILNFSTLPGNAEFKLRSKIGTLLTNVVGTCGRNCKKCFHKCYARNSALRYHNTVIQAWGENTLLLRNKKVWGMIEKYLNARRKLPDMFRINVSGEIESVEELEQWTRLATIYPTIKFGIYTKNFDAVDAYLTKHHDTPSNFCINISQWNHVADKFLAKWPTQCNIFEYDSTNEKDCDFSEEDKLRLANIDHCPAVDSKGRHIEGVTCQGCGICYRKEGTHTAVYSH